MGAPGPSLLLPLKKEVLSPHEGELMTDLSDLKRLKWTPPKGKRKHAPAPKSGTPKLPRPTEDEAYLSGPIPITWIQHATALSGRTWQVATALWFVGNRSRTKSATVTLTEKVRLYFNLSKHAVWRGLQQLAKAGLIRVERRSGRCSAVTILPAKAKRESKSVKTILKEFPCLRKL
jgi:hypothetical protein